MKNKHENVFNIFNMINILNHKIIRKNKHFEDVKKSQAHDKEEQAIQEKNIWKVIKRIT